MDFTLPLNADALRIYRRQRFENSRREGNARLKVARQMTKARQELVQSFARHTLARLVPGPERGPDKEMLLWFWFNHFNVFWGKDLVGVALPDYVNSAIRPHVLGNFRDMLLATLSHPAMLVYLDNHRNAAGRINENLARELLELHTLGVDGGYSQQDVQQTALVLTGLGLRPPRPFRLAPRLAPLLVERGEFMFDPRRHDFSEKQILGQTVAPTGFAEVEALADILVAHPATARHIAGRLGLFLLGDRPPQAAIDQAATIFTHTRGDLAQTTAALLGFSSRVTEPSFKDPLRFVLSAMRLLSRNNQVDNVRPLARWLTLLGQPLFGRQTPDGYDLRGSQWQSSGQLTQRFELSREMVQLLPKLMAKPTSARRILQQHGLAQLHRDGQPPANGFGSRLSQSTLQALRTAENPRDRLALVLASPEFMYWLPEDFHAPS